VKATRLALICYPASGCVPQSGPFSKSGVSVTCLTFEPSGVRGVDVLLAVDPHAEHDLRPVRRPVRLEGEALALEMNKAGAVAVGVDGEQVALRGLRDDLVPVGRPSGRSDVVRVCEAVGRDLPKASPVDVLNEQPDPICAVVRSRWPWAKTEEDELGAVRCDVGRNVGRAVGVRREPDGVTAV
jgi:hypothetical protein